MSESKLRIQSMDFAVSIISLVKSLKGTRESIISNQIGRSGTSIGANVCEAQYAHFLHPHRKGEHKLKKDLYELQKLSYDSFEQ